jgi:hypothetical protein
MNCGTANAMATALNSLSSFLPFFLSNANTHKTDFQLAILRLLLLLLLPPSNRVLGWLVSRSLLCDKNLANDSERPVPRDPSVIPRGSNPVKREHGGIQTLISCKQNILGFVLGQPFFAFTHCDSIHSKVELVSHYVC